MAPGHLAGNIDQFLRAVGVEGFDIGIGAGEGAHVSRSVLTRSLAARFATAPICPQVQQHDGVFLAVSSLAALTMGVERVRRTLLTERAN